MLGAKETTLGVRDKDRLTISSVLIDIQAERDRQNELRDAGKFNHTCADPGVGQNLSPILQDMLANHVILAEEFGEVANELNELAQLEHWLARNWNGSTKSLKLKWVDLVPIPPSSGIDDLSAWIETIRKLYLTRMREELVQVAAVTLAMIERLDLEVMG